MVAAGISNEYFGTCSWVKQTPGAQCSKEQGMDDDRIAVLIADDSAPFRQGLRAMLGTTSDMVVVGEATTGAQAIAMAYDLQPDVILMDLQMPDGHGLDATQRILHTSPHIRIVVLTMFDDDDSVFAALQTGARGYLLKGALKAEMLRAIRGANNGEAIFGPAIAQRLMQYFGQGVPANRAQDVFPELTEREREILALLAQRLTNQEIAERLVLSTKTVRNHVSNIFSKLQVADRTHAIMRARDAGLR
jgi:DNA-binding NarL/FixJ family response regulator